MGISGSNSAARQIDTIFEGGSVAGLSNAQLLERYVRRRDAGAFEALVARHAPMVLSVCRSLLANSHDAEDAFQATFLVLARKATQIREPELLGPWLYGVAQRTARKCRSTRGRVANRERNELEAAATIVRPEVQTPMLESDEQSVLHEEIERLPERYRSAIVLCYLQGLTHADAARSLRRPEGTISARLSRARDILRTRLTRRGLTPSVALAALAAGSAASATAPRPLIDSTVSALTEGPTTSVALLVEGVIRAMGHTRLVAISFALLGSLGLMAVAYATIAPLTGPKPIEEEKPFAPTKGSGAEPPTARNVKPDTQLTAPITVKGRAVDESDKPVAGATIVLVSTNGVDLELGKARTDANGNYTFHDAKLPVRRWREDAAPQGTFQVYGTARGYGIAWHGMRTHIPVSRPDDVPPDGKSESPIYSGEPISADLTFRPAVPLRGRVVDEAGKPVEDATINLYNADYTDLEDREQHKNFREFWAMRMLPSKETSARTDREGRFQIEGFGRGIFFAVHVGHPKFASRTVLASTSDQVQRLSLFVGAPATDIAANDFEINLPPAFSVPVRIVHADTGKPAAKMRVSAMTSLPLGDSAYGLSNAEGFLTLKLPAGSYGITIDAPNDSNCVRTQATLDVEAVTANRTTELKVDRGCVLILEAVDGDTGMGIRGVSFRQGDEDGRPGATGEVQSNTYMIDNPSTNAEGRLRTVVYPGRRSFAVVRVPKDSGYFADQVKHLVDLPGGEEVTVRFELSKVK
jgi:RNA polymerase sigma factor (sigma-70 family)